MKLIPDHLRITFNTNYTKCQDDTTNWFSREREFLDRERESPFRERDKTWGRVSREETCPISSQQFCFLLLITLQPDPKGFSLIPLSPSHIYTYIHVDSYIYIYIIHTKYTWVCMYFSCSCWGYNFFLVHSMCLFFWFFFTFIYVLYAYIDDLISK